jgi:hypothetical protein
MSYTSASNVFPYCRTIIAGSAFTTTTIPTDTDVTNWLTEGYAIINTALASRGYSTPVASAATCYAQVAGLEALYGAAQAHSARAVQVTSADEATKGQVIMRIFRDGVKNLLSQDLSLAGVTHTSYVYAGGISIADKNTVEEDTDRVAPAFHRGIHSDRSISYSGADTNSDD